MSNISVLFCGDYAPCRRFEQIVLRDGGRIFGDLAEDIRNADLAVVNLETPLCINGEKILKCGPNLKAHPNCIQSLSEVGFDVIGLANNHIMDYGLEGLRSTIAACERNSIYHVGAGENIHQAEQPIYINRKEINIAIIAAAEYEFNIATTNRPGSAHIDAITLLNSIEKAKKIANLVFVSLHGGNEYFPYPRPNLRKICKFCIERGADAVICHHSHVAGSYEMHYGKPIVYSLGNLIFDSKNPPIGWDTGYAFHLSYSKKNMNLQTCYPIPYRQSIALNGVKKLRDRELDEFTETLKIYSSTLKNHSEYLDKWTSYVKDNTNNAILQNYSPFTMRGLGLIARIITPSLMFMPTKKSQISKLNALRCESHIELLINAIEHLVKQRN